MGALKSREVAEDNWQGKARTQSPTRKNCDVELPTFGVIVGVSQTEVQWKGLALGERPSWSSLLPAQVSMLNYGLYRIDKENSETWFLLESETFLAPTGRICCWSRSLTIFRLCIYLLARKCAVDSGEFLSQNIGTKVHFRSSLPTPMLPSIVETWVQSDWWNPSRFGVARLPDAMRFSLPSPRREG